MPRLLPDPPSRTGGILTRRELDAALRVLAALRKTQPATIIMAWDNAMQDALRGLEAVGYIETYRRPAPQKATAPFKPDTLSTTPLGLEYLASIQSAPAPARHHATRKKPKQLDAEIAASLRGTSSAEGYRVAYGLVTRRDGKVVTVRAIVDAPRPLTLAEAEAWRRTWGKSHTAWIETMSGAFVPVSGAKRPGKFMADARQGDVHALLTQDRRK